MITKGGLRNWVSIAIELNSERIEIINIYRIPITLWNRFQCSLTKSNIINIKLKSTTEYRKELLNEIKQHIVKTTEIDNIIIAGDHN